MSAFKFLKGILILVALAALLVQVASGATFPSTIAVPPGPPPVEAVTAPVATTIPGPIDNQVETTADTTQAAITTAATGADEVTNAVGEVIGPTPVDEVADGVVDTVAPVEETVDKTVEDAVTPVLGTPVPVLPTGRALPVPPLGSTAGPTAGPVTPGVPTAPIAPTPGTPRPPVVPGATGPNLSPQTAASSIAPSPLQIPAAPATAGGPVVVEPVGSAETPDTQGLFAELGDAFAEFKAAVPDWAWPIILALIALTLIASVRSYVEGRRRRRAVSDRRQAADDLLLLQSMLLPSLPRELGSLGVSAAYQPADGLASGGDFYDVFLTPDGCVAALLGDVSGHGRDAVTRATLARYTMRAFLMDGAGPGAALAAADRGLTQDLDLDSFVTAIIASYDPNSGRLTYAQAGHHPPLFVGLDDYDPESGPSGPPLGASLAQDWPERTIALPPGARLCLFTDGVIEARSGGKLFGRERLAQLFAQVTDGEELLERVQAESDLVADDLAVLVLSASQVAEVPVAHPALRLAASR